MRTEGRRSSSWAGSAAVPPLQTNPAKLTWQPLTMPDEQPKMSEFDSAGQWNGAGPVARPGPGVDRWVSWCVLTAVALLLAAVVLVDFRTLTGQTMLGTPGQPTPAYERISSVVGQAPEVRLIPALLGLAGVAFLSRSAAVSKRARWTAAALAVLLTLLLACLVGLLAYVLIAQAPDASATRFGLNRFDELGTQLAGAVTLICASAMLLRVLLRPGQPTHEPVPDQPATVDEFAIDVATSPADQLAVEPSDSDRLPLPTLPAVTGSTRPREADPHARYRPPPP